MYKPSNKKFVGFIVFCIIGIALIIINPTYETPVEKFEKIRYQGKYHLAIGENVDAVEKLYKAMTMGEEIFFPTNAYGGNEYTTLNPENITNKDTKALSQTMIAMRDSFLENDGMLEVYLSLALGYSRIGARDEAIKVLTKASKNFPGNPFITLCSAAIWVNHDHDKARELLILPPKGTNIEYRYRKMFRIFDTLIDEASKFTNRETLIKYFGS